MHVYPCEYTDVQPDTAHLIKEATARQPHPVEVIDAPVGVQQQLIKDTRSSRPTLPQVAPSQEAGHHVPCQMMYPALLIRWVVDVRAGPQSEGSSS